MLGRVLLKKIKGDVDKLSVVSVSDKNPKGKVDSRASSNPDIEEAARLMVERSYATIGHGFEMRQNTASDIDQTLEMKPTKWHALAAMLGVNRIHRIVTPTRT